ncbi:hypothetical protein [Helicobacter rodentium]|uniref:hypothetical protein n=1 Tax=Helicobacter rodentium TaxID=59617 RepID=UPI0023567CA5|nr:hypothetical protein [Helicobacter rodentium]
MIGTYGTTFFIQVILNCIAAVCGVTLAFFALFKKPKERIIADDGYRPICVGSILLFGKGI